MYRGLCHARLTHHLRSVTWTEKSFTHARFTDLLFPPHVPRAESVGHSFESVVGLSHSTYHFRLTPQAESQRSCRV